MADPGKQFALRREFRPEQPSYLLEYLLRVLAPMNAAG